MLRLVASITKRWGSQSAKQRVWDSEYRGGKWDVSQEQLAGTDPIYQSLDRYGVDARILDLGCGGGVTALEMTSEYREYVGVDVSDVAVASAIHAVSLDPKRAGKTSFCVGDIANFRPAGEFNVILFRESIYYLPLHQIKKALNHYSAFLGKNGVFIVRLCNRYKYTSISELLQKNLQIDQKFLPADSKTAIIIGSPAS